MWNLHTVSGVRPPWEHGETYQQAIREVKTKNGLRVVGRMMGG